MKKALILIPLFFGLSHTLQARSLYYTGFELGDTSELQAAAGTQSVSSAVAHSGTYSYLVNPAGSGTGACGIAGILATGRISLVAEISTANYSSFYFYWATKSTNTAGEEFFAAQDTNTTTGLALRLNSNANIVAYNNAAVSLSTGSLALAASTWYRIDVFVTTGTTGQYAVKVNGNAEISGTGAFGTQGFGRIALGKITNRNNTTVQYRFDDFAWSDTAYPGSQQTTYMVPAATGTFTGWLLGGGLSGAHWQQLIEIPPDGITTYIETGVANSSDSVKLGSTTITAADTVNSVKFSADMEKNGPCSPTAKVFFRSGVSTTSTNTSLTILTTFALYSKILDTDPNTGVAWTLGALNSGLQVGVVSIVDTCEIDNTWEGIMINYTPAPVAVAASSRRRISVN